MNIELQNLGIKGLHSYGSAIDGDKSNFNSNGTHNFLMGTHN